MLESVQSGNRVFAFPKDIKSEKEFNFGPDKHVEFGRSLPADLALANGGGGRMGSVSVDSVESPGI